MEKSTLEKLENFRLTGNAYGDMFQEQKEKAVSLIKLVTNGGVSLADIYVNDYANDHFIELTVDLGDSVLTVNDFSDEKANFEWIVSTKKSTANPKGSSVTEMMAAKIISERYEQLVSQFGPDTIVKAINESKYLDFKNKRIILRSIQAKNYGALFEKLNLLSLHEAKTYTESDIKSLVSDYFGEVSKLSINTKMVGDFNDRYALMMKNSGSYKTNDMNLLLDEWFGYWSENGLISKSDIDKAEDRKLDNEESQVPNDIKNFFRKSGYKYVGHNQKFKVYTYTIGIGKDDPNFITATLDMTDKTLRLLNPNQQDIVQSADNLSSIKLPTTVDEFNALVVPDKEKSTETSESANRPKAWVIEPIHLTMEYFDGKDIFQIFMDSGLGNKNYITISQTLVDDFNRKFNELKVGYTPDVALKMTLDYVIDNHFTSIFEAKPDTTYADEIAALLEKDGEYTEDEIAECYGYLYLKTKPYDDSMKADIVNYFVQNPTDDQSKAFVEYGVHHNK